MRAAVANGADAVYFGLGDYNARRRATNFTIEQLPEAMRYLHGHNVRGYVTLNTVIFSDEMAKAARYVAHVAEAGADAVILQDLGLVRLVRRLAPSLPIHASTQTTQTEPRGIELLRSLGVTRVILARELSLAEIEQVRRATPVEIEVFVHGALCVSYSGQCLASLSLLGRSANRGVCAQACRLPYTLIVDGRPLDLADQRYLLSPKDLAAHDRVADLVRLGVSGLKIEGRLKSPTYVAAATRVYREAIDAAVAGRPYRLSRDRELELAQGFSRGFTHGCLDGTDHLDLVQARSPKNRGVRIGTVAGKTPQGVVVRLDAPGASAAPAATDLKPGDGVVFDEGRHGREEQGGRIYTVKPTPGGFAPSPGGAGPLGPPHDASATYPVVRRRRATRGQKPDPSLVEITFRAEDVDLGAVPVGSTVWRTDDPQVRRRLEQTYSRDLVVRRVPLSIRVRAVIGKPLEIAAVDEGGSEVQVASDLPLEKARKHPLAADLLREQFGRLGDTPFELATVEIIANDGPAQAAPVMAPKSVLNDLRRRLVEALIERRNAAARHAIADPDALGALRREIPAPVLESEPATSALSRYVLVRSLGQLRAVLGGSPRDSLPPPTLVWCDLTNPADYSEAVTRGRDAGVPVGLATPRVVKQADEPLLERMLDAGPDTVLVRNLGALAFFRERGPGLRLVGDFSLNITNEIAAAVAADLGLARFAPGADLEWPQVAALLRRVAPGLIEVIVHQHVPLFHTEHCLPAARVSGARDRRGCGSPCRTHRIELRDRNGVEHPVVADAACRCTVFDARPRSLAKWVPEMIGAGVRHFRVELLRESPEQIPDLLGRYWGLLNRRPSS